MSWNFSSHAGQKISVEQYIWLLGRYSFQVFARFYPWVIAILHVLCNMIQFFKFWYSIKIVYRKYYKGKSSQSNQVNEETWSRNLKKVNTQKFLESKLITKLAFHIYINSLSEKASQQLNALLRVIYKLKIEQRHLSLNVFITSQFLYDPTVWMFYNQKQNNQIDIIQGVTVSTPKWGQITMIYQTDCLLLINMYKSL